jgi:REP element-mobilizing transposase RayT
VVNREFVLGREEKEYFVLLLRRYERFCGVRILTFCVMSNHFHLLLEVPPRPEGGLSDQELCERLEELKGEAEGAAFRALLERCRAGGDEEGAEALRQRLLYRMWDLSEFMKTFKQCFSRWFNHRHDRHGTLWEERFKNVLVQDGRAARVMGAYIDLNPLRAGMVGRPEDYRWCGYAEAMAGGGEARAGITRLMEEYEKLAGGEPPKRSWGSVMAAYRVIVYGDGEVRYRENEGSGQTEVARRGMSREEVEEVLANGGELSGAQMVRCRVRAFTEGVVLGTKKFAEEFFEARRSLFGPTRKDGARPIHGCATDLCCARGIRRDALGAAK